MWWPSTCISLLLYAAEPPAFLADGEFLAAASAAAEAWDSRRLACTSLKIDIVPRQEPNADTGNDGVNRITFRRTTWCPEPRDPTTMCYDAAALAVTTVSAQRRNGLILDTDVELNAVHYRWWDVGGGGPRNGVHDLQNTLTHEFGHVLGFDHTCYKPENDQPRPSDHNGTSVVDCASASADLRATTLYPEVRIGDTERRTLADDDQLAACDTYPRMPSGTCGPTVAPEGGCECAQVGHARSSRIPWPAWLAGASLLPLLLGRRTRGTQSAFRSRRRTTSIT